jgi:hypothetical protein
VNTPWLLAVLFVLSLAALARLVGAVLRLLRTARLGDVPLLELQGVTFPTAGRIVLCMEGPRFTPRFRKLEFELGLPGGARLTGHRILLRTVTSGIRHARLTLREFDLPFAGRYELYVTGLAPTDRGAAGHRIVFMRPHLARALLLVVGITLASTLAIVSLVFLLLSVVPEAVAIDPGRADGRVEIGGERIELQQAYAHLHAKGDRRQEIAPELRLVLADREIPQQSLAGLPPLPVLDLARDGQVRGLLVRLNPGDPGTLWLTPLLPATATSPAAERRHEGAGDCVLRNLRVSPQRVGGDLECPSGAGLQCKVHFSAPLFTD